VAARRQHPVRSFLGWKDTLPAFFCAVSLSFAANAGEIYPELPAELDPQRFYLIFLQGPVAGEPVARGFARRGFEVVTERRRPSSDPLEQARKTMAQVTALLQGGVPGSRIAVAGYDLGGTAAMIASALIRDPSISYVVLAGCGLDERYERFAAQLADQMAGRMLHLWEKTDPRAESCQYAFSQAPQLDSDEKLLSNDGGHELFWEPAPFWMDILQQFLERR
jgi:predicted esterase